MVFDYENRTRKPVKFPMKKPGGFLSHFFARVRSGSGRQLDRWPTGGVVGDLRRLSGGVLVAGLLWLFFVPWRHVAGCTYVGIYPGEQNTATGL